jgi:hypothetical protein
MTDLTIRCPGDIALGKVEGQLEGIALAQHKANDYETLVFLIDFYCCFNRVLLRGECTPEVKQNSLRSSTNSCELVFERSETGWKEPPELSSNTRKQLQAIAYLYHLKDDDEAIQFLIQRYTASLNPYYPHLLPQLKDK